MNKPDFYYSDDYAGLSFKNGNFYYGYETTSGDDDEWCFVAKFNDEVIIIPHSKLGTEDQFDVVENLNIGIGWILAKYELTESNEQ